MAWSINVRRGRFSTPLSMGTLGLLLGGLVLVPTVPAAAADTTFYSSFETDDPEPLANKDADEGPSNFTGDSYAEGSLLGLIDDVTGTDSENSPDGEQPAKAADGNPDTKWLTFEDTGTLTYELSEAAAITEYTITSANDSPDRDPRDFTVQGSNDGDEWEELDAQTDQAWEDGDDKNRKTKTSYELDERSDEYSYYRLEITKNNGDSILQLADFELIDADREIDTSPMVTEISDGPESSETAKTGVGFTGTKALKYEGQVVEDGDASATNLLYEDVDVEIQQDSELSYLIFPELDSDLTYAATYAAIDIEFDDETRLSETDATDAYGYGAGASSRGEGNILWPDQWNSVKIDLGQFAGKTIENVLVSFDQPGAVGGTPVKGFIDDVSIDKAEELDTSDGLVSYVDTRRGTNSTGGFSRGNNLPATAWPNGFNFITPMTNADTHSTIYHYQKENNSDNLPALQGIGFSHQPSIWMGDRNQLAVLPADTDSPSSDLSERELPFTHDNEVARPDIYSVEFENGLETSVTPTDHGAIYKFGFTGSEGSVLIDEVDGSSDLTVNDDGEVSGWVEGGSGYPGRTRMFVAGTFDTTPTNTGNTPNGNRDSARYAAFDTGSNEEVHLEIATSFLSVEQAERNLDQELTGRSFDEVHQDVTDEWNDRLGVITDIQGATDDQLTGIYSGLYRLNLYPNSQFENVGTLDDPEYQYASPVSDTSGDATDTETNAEIVDGKMYVNNGFWDTYRTAWPAYAMFYPHQTEELVDGFVQQYRDGGWISRWSSPGYADLMTGTSSDVSFAEAYQAGSLSTDLALEAYDAAVKNATVLPSSESVGRKGLDESIFLGFTDSSTPESASWGLEGFINDFGIAEMARSLAEDPDTPEDRVAQLEDEAEYFEARSKNYANMYNPEAGVFTDRNSDGSWPVGEDFDKKEWGGAFTEASAWTFAFHAPHDVEGMAALYGDRQDLIDELDDFLTTPEKADYSGIHEAREARDVRMGMLGMSNQVAHHIPYVLAEAGDVSGSQELIHEITQRLFAGSDIGQGYPGDEDNGEMSAWYIFSLLGFYPLEVGSGDYTIGSPGIDGATLHLGDEELTISAPGASDGKKYVAGVTHNGEDLTETTVDGDLLRSGGELKFEMSDTPSDWGAKDLDEDLEKPDTLVDVTGSGYGSVEADDTDDTDALADDAMSTATVFPSNQAAITWTSNSGPIAVDQYTLTSTSDGAAPSSWKLLGSVDGEDWTEVDSREGESFPHETQTRPFSTSSDGELYTQYRLEVDDTENGDDLALAEWELFAADSASGSLDINASSDLTAKVDEEFDDHVATVSGEDMTSSGEVLVDYRDGTGSHEAELTENDLGGWQVTAPHTFDRPGVYSAEITATDDAGATASATATIRVTRDETLAGHFNNVCIGDEGKTAGSCDGQGYSYFRDKLADNGFTQGETLDVPDTDLSYDLPDIPAGEPDNVTNEGQTFSVDLGDDATQISVIGTANENAQDLAGTLTFDDGSEQQIPIQFGDWVGTANDPEFDNIQVGLSEGRLSGKSPEGQVKDTAIFATDPVDLDEDDGGEAKRAVELTLPEGEGTLRDDGRAHIFALASDGDREDNASLELEPADVETQIVDAEFEALLATVTSSAPESDVDAVINWGDGSEVSVLEDVGDEITAEHVYEEPGTYDVEIVADDGVTSSQASTSIEVEEESDPYAPEIDLSADEVATGESFTVSGSGFAPGESVTLTLSDDDTVLDATADDDGAFDVEMTAPEVTATTTFVVSAIGETSQDEANSSLRVTVESPPSDGDDGSAEDGSPTDDSSSDGWLPKTGMNSGLLASIAGGFMLIGFAIQRRFSTR